MNSARSLSLGLALVALVPAPAFASLFSFDGSSEPDSATFGPTFTTIVFPATSWASNGDVLTMNTAVGQGIWFGAGYAYGDNPAWNLSDNTIGNGLSLRTKVSADATEWSAYLADGSKFAGLIFNNTSVQYHTDTGYVTHALDGTQFHTYGFVLKEGLVAYTLDDALLYNGPAANSSGYIGLIGDGSATTLGGTGQFLVDYAIWDNAPTSLVPVPESGYCAVLSLLGCAGFAVWRRVRSLRT